VLAPYGMPLKTVIPSCAVPRTLPDNVSTTRSDRAADEDLACPTLGTADADENGSRTPTCASARTSDACLRNRRRGVPVSLSTRSRNASKARVFLAFGVFERDAVAKEAGTVRDRTSGSGRSVQRGRECDAANRWVDRAERWRAASDSRWSSVARRINAKPACRKSAAWRANSRLRRWYPSVVWLTIIAFLLASTFSDSSS